MTKEEERTREQMEQEFESDHHAPEEESSLWQMSKNLFKVAVPIIVG